MTIPRPALYLGLAGLLPFLWGVATQYIYPLADWTLSWLGPRFAAPYVMLSYGTVILAFMSGVIWGFSTRADGRVATTGYVLSVIPALWAFFMVGGGPYKSAIYLIVGFVGLLAIDFLFWQQHLAPPWWMKLRLLLTAVVVACLSTVFL